MPELIAWAVGILLALGAVAALLLFVGWPVIGLTWAWIELALERRKARRG